jgi:hypothetical protein
MADRNVDFFCTKLSNIERPSSPDNRLAGQPDRHLLKWPPRAFKEAKEEEEEEAVIHGLPGKQAR